MNTSIGSPGANTSPAGPPSALYGLAVLIAAAVLGLALVLPAWLAALVVGVVVLAIAGVAA